MVLAIVIILLLMLALITRRKTRFPDVVSGGAYSPNALDYYSQIRGAVPETLRRDRPCELVKDVPGQLKFCQIVPTTTIHLGQLKLLLSEIQFMNKIRARDGDVDCLIIYAGSAPSNKGWVFSQMFPRAKMILVDPAEHVIVDMGVGAHEKPVGAHEKLGPHGPPAGPRTNYTDPDMVRYLAAGSVNKYGHVNRKVKLWSGEELDKDADADKLARAAEEFSSDPAAGLAAAIASNCRIFIAECYFTNKIADEIARVVGSRVPVYFVSDIRTSTDDAGIIWNNCMQYNWIHRMKPAYSLLKFRAPFFDNLGTIADYMRGDIAEAAGRGLDALADYSERRYRYFAGEDYLQAYSRLTSAETRLMVTGVPPPVEIDWNTRERRLFYYNAVHRPFVFHTDPVDLPAGIDHCSDCALGVQILEDYLAYTRCEYLDSRVRMHAFANGRAVGYMSAIVATIGRNLSHGPLDTQLTKDTIAGYINSHTTHSHGRHRSGPASPKGPRPHL